MRTAQFVWPVNPAKFLRAATYIMRALDARMLLLFCVVDAIIEDT